MEKEDLRGVYGALACSACTELHCSCLQNSSQQGSAQQGRPVPELRIQAVFWSPCASLEHASRWLMLEAVLEEPSLNHYLSQAPIVVDMGTGQQVCFWQGSSS